MKKSLRNQALTLSLAGLVVTGLVFFNVVSRQQYEGTTLKIDRLHEAVVQPLLTAKTNFFALPQEGDASTTNKLVRVPVEGVKAFLDNAYTGKDADMANLTGQSEAAGILIKLALLEVDNTLESLATPGTPISIDKTIDAGRKLEEHFTRAASAQHSMLVITSWTSVVVLLTVFAAITAWNYFSDKKRLTQSSEIDQRLTLEARRVETLSGFIEAMASGNYSVQLDTDPQDELNQTLVTMRDKLKSNAEEDQRRNWATSGLAQIGEILRASSNTSAELYDSIVKFVVRYTRSNQGGLFIINDDDSQHQHLDLVACYAFERKKFLTRTVDIGQGLVGQCFLERERIYLRDVPADYVRITSGLGGENPRSCLLVPLKVNDKIYGVLELASFGLYQEFEIGLVEKLAESIASTISSVRINDSTRALLERTQQQAEEMKSQEEEMRQNMEELSATQEEMQRKESEYLLRIRQLEELQGVEAR